jgi:hypothetical protein
VRAAAIAVRPNKSAPHASTGTEANRVDAADIPRAPPRVEASMTRLSFRRALELLALALLSAWALPLTRLRRF